MCVYSSIDADTENQKFLLRIGGVGGWVLGNTNVLRTENNTLYLRTAPEWIPLRFLLNNVADVDAPSSGP